MLHILCYITQLLTVNFFHTIAHVTVRKLYMINCLQGLVFAVSQEMLGIVRGLNSVALIGDSYSGLCHFSCRLLLAMPPFSRS